MKAVTPVVEHLDIVRDYKSWLDTLPGIGSLTGHSKPRVFRFKEMPTGGDQGDQGAGDKRVLMHVRQSMDDPKSDNPDGYEPQEGIDILPQGARLPRSLPLVPRKPLNIDALIKSKSTLPS
jgi:hypothetical protein